MVLRRWEGIAGNLVLTTELKRKLATVNSKKADVSSVGPFINRSDEGLTLETSAFLLFIVANLRFQLGC